MPTPEARLATMLDHATAADPTGVLLYFHTPAEAEAFLADYTRSACQGALPQTGGGTMIVSDEEFERIKEVLDNPAPPTEAIIRGAETLRRLPTPPENMPPQTGGVRGVV